MWRVAVLFMVGSLCFALGAAPGYVLSVGARADGVTYFVGSLFFTAASMHQLLISVGVVPTRRNRLSAVRWRALVRAPRRPEWWSGVVQAIGTLLFNVSTFAALHQSFTVVQQDRRVWTPDALGSIAFLVSSVLAFADVRRPWLTWRPHDLAWSIAVLNLVGSIAFGISAVAGYVVPTTGDLLDAQLDNAGTFVGAICFLVGAALLIPDDQAIEDPTVNPSAR